MADDFGMGYALGADSGGGNNGGGMFNGDAFWGIILLALLFGNRGFGGGFGGGGNGNNDGCCRCATTEDVRAAVDQQTLISKIDQQTYGLSDVFTALNTNLNNNFRGVDNAICTLGFQNQQGFSGLGAQLAACCCDIERGIERSTTQGVMNTNTIQQQISKCCCDLEMMNMQNRFDAQNYNCSTLQAIDKLGDRIEGRLNAMETAKLREQLDSERTRNAILQGSIDRAQLRYDIVNDVRPCPIPAYITCNPYAASWGTGYSGYGNNGCGCGCGCG